MIYIIGAGISGLTTADNLKREFLVFEKGESPGGLSTQYKSGKYFFDFSGHYFHFAGKDEIRRYVEQFSRFHRYQRDSRIRMFGKLIPFPVQYHLSYFPGNTGVRILNEMKRRSADGHRNMRESLTGTFGETLYKLFFEPFLTKYYRRDLSKIVPETDKGSIPVPDLISVEEGLGGRNFSDTGYNPVFYYPHEGLKSFIKSMEKGISEKIRYNEAVIGINLTERILVTEKGEYPFSGIVNTMPLRELAGILTPRPPWAPKPGEFESVSTLVVNMVLREQREKFHWVYLPEGESPFYRAGYYPGHPETACYAERTLVDGEEFDRDDTAREVTCVLRDLNMIRDSDDILHMDMKVIPGSYIIFTPGWRAVVPGFLKKLRETGIYSVGRYGSWNYSSMSDDIKSGKCTAELLNGER